MLLAGPLMGAEAPAEAGAGATAGAAATGPAAPANAATVQPPLATPAGSEASTPARTPAEQILFPDLALPPGPESNAPPRLLSPGTPPDSRVPPLVLVPVIATREPIPRTGAGNCVQRDERGRFMGWMDRQQCVFSGRALTTARWIDDFFGDWHDDEASMLARLITRTTMVEGEGVKTKVSLHASLSLPNAKRRMRLLVSDEEEEDPTGQELRRQRQPGQLPESDRVSTALRWISMEKDGLQSNFDVGARGIDPMDIFARYRLRKTWSLTDESIARLSQTLRYGSDTKERYTPELDLERALDNRTVLRFGNYYDYSNELREQGFLWSHGLSLSRALRNSRSYSYGVSLAGHTRPTWRGESYGPWVAWRSRFLRPWLFYEVEPRLTYYRSRDWDGVVSVLLKVEMQFGWK
ncbi:MAG TPA: hypothetical protein VFV15_07795 [Moraxellaceae bacterium]|nr:hypothetical protein [Moraxellaceae bacterium]